MSYFLVIAGILLCYMNAWFFVSLAKKRNDVADVAWGLGFVLIAWASFALSGTMTVRGPLVCALVTMWGLRLALHVYARNKGRPEDSRYRAWREEWGGWFYIRSYVQIYLLQGALLYAIALPVLMINRGNETNLTALDALGVVIWLVGFYFEVVGDAQLARFIKNPANQGKLMQSGLWSYSRHPNYFGEVTLWWGIWLIALSASNGWLAVVGPLTITILITKVSGIPMLEKKMAENPDFAQYKERVSAFFPLFPKNYATKNNHRQ